MASKVVKLGKKNINVLSHRMVRLGVGKKPIQVGELFSLLTKRESRKLRKELYAAGHIYHASARPIYKQEEK